MHVQKPSRPEPAAKPAADAVPGNASGAPGRGAAAKNHVRPGYQACTFSVSQPGRYRSCLAWHASRGWSRVGTWLPCPDEWTSVAPFYDEITGLDSPGVW